MKKTEPKEYWLCQYMAGGWQVLEEKPDLELVGDCKVIHVVLASERDEAQRHEAIINQQFVEAEAAIGKLRTELDSLYSHCIDVHSDDPESQGMVDVATVLAETEKWGNNET